mgnify:CR=1 FL=1
MKITVRVIGILEAEMELPEPGGVSPLGLSNWTTWHANQYEHANRFIDRCAVQASAIMRESRGESTTPES